MNTLLSSFGLTDSQMRILFSLECYMASYDALQEPSMIEKINPLSGEHNMKYRWYQKFRADLNTFINRSDENCVGSAIYDTPSGIITAISTEDSKSENNLWKYLIMLECTLFVPYFPLSTDKEENKPFKGLKFSDNSRTALLKTISTWLGIDYGFVTDCEKTYQGAIKKLTGYWKKVFIGVGAGIVAALLTVATAGGSIAAMFAASGLYGAAAVSSGLAALGGGAIAAGGLGMAGGMAVLVGGGLLLGSGAGAAISMTLASTDPTAVMTETAKLYVVMKEIVLALNHDTKRAQEIVASVIDKIAEMKKEVTTLKLEQKKMEEKIKNLEKSIRYLEKFLDMSK